jgi:hypothetical protein
MKKENIYLLTSVNKIPVLLVCKSEEQAKKYMVKKSITISEDCYKANIASGNFVGETNSQKVADMINLELTDFYQGQIWVDKRYAII